MPGVITVLKTVITEFFLRAALRGTDMRLI